MSAIKGSIRCWPHEPIKKETPADKLAPSLWEKKQQVYECLRVYQDGGYDNHCVLIGQLDVALSGLYDELVKIL